MPRVYQKGLPRKRHGDRPRGAKPAKLYGIWRSAYSRCHTPGYANYENYGGRGLTVCEEWRWDYSAFKAWALANGYKEGLSLDRIDNDKGYEPGNCRWATKREQTFNRGVSIFYKGEPLILHCERAGLPYYQVWCRYRRYGWSLEKALTTPLQKHTRRTERNLA